VVVIYFTLILPLFVHFWNTRVLRDTIISLTNKVARLSLFRSVRCAWVSYDEFCSDRQIPTLYNRRNEISKSFLPSPFSIRTVVYITSYPLLGLALSINLDAAHSIFLRLQKLPDFIIPSYSMPLIITKLNLPTIAVSLCMLFLCALPTCF